jgi:hypothetical protein
VTVCTNDLALRNLVAQSSQVAVPQTFGDIELFIPKVVELQDERVCLAAVGTRPAAEELDYVFRTLRRDGLLATQRIGDVALAICRVMLVLVIGAARSAVVVALAPRLPTPSEVGGRLMLATAAAAPGWFLGRLVHGERMFASKSDGRLEHCP